MEELGQISSNIQSIGLGGYRRFSQPNTSSITMHSNSISIGPKPIGQTTNEKGVIGIRKRLRSIFLHAITALHSAGKGKDIVLEDKGSQKSLKNIRLFIKNAMGDLQVTKSLIVETDKILTSYSSSESQLHGISSEVQGKVNQYVLLRELGSGSFGRVVLAFDQGNLKQFACKVISKNRIRKKLRFCANSVSKFKNIMAEIKNEVVVLKQVANHPNIVTLYEVINDKREDLLYLVFGLCEMGPVMCLNPCSDPVTPFSEAVAKKYIRDIVNGLEFLHSRNVIHRDIKPENIFLNADCTVVIGDFGLSIIVKPDNINSMVEVKSASPLFASPESCAIGATFVNGKAADIWSLGLTLYAFTHGHCPFEDTHPIFLNEMIVNDPVVISDTLSSPLKSILCKLLDKNPTKRPGISELKSDSWLTDFGLSPMISTVVNCLIRPVPDEEIQKTSTTVLNFFAKLSTKISHFGRSKKASRRVRGPSSCPANISTANPTRRTRASTA